jgi:hypothetical protein
MKYKNNSYHLGHPSSIVLPWKSVNDNILQTFQLNKGSVKVTLSVAVNKNKNSDYHRFSRNVDCEKIEVSAEYDHEVSLVTTAGGSSPGMIVDCRKYENIVVSVDSQTETGVNCVAISLKGKVDSKEMDHMGKPSRVNNDS